MISLSLWSGVLRTGNRYIKHENPIDLKKINISSHQAPQQHQGKTLVSF